MQLVLSELYYTLIRFKYLLHGVKLSSTTLFTCQIQTVFSGLLIPLWGQTLFIFFTFIEENISTYLCYIFNLNGDDEGFPLVRYSMLWRTLAMVLSTKLLYT